MASTERIIAAFGGREGLVTLTGARLRTVEQWSRIGIPHKHFDRLVKAARRRGIPGITHEALYAAKAATMARACRRAA